MEKKRNFGIVGAGLIADFHAKAIENIEGAKVIGFCDNGSGRSKQLAKKYSCQAFHDHEQMIRDENINMITIASPSGAHMEPAIFAAQYGKHVICEKPIEILPERIDKMIEAHEKHGTVLGGIFNYRYDEAIADIKMAVEKGRFKKIVHAAVHVPWWRPDEYYNDNWHGTWKLDGGGALMNQSIHMIDLLQYLIGDVDEVKAFAATAGHDIEVEDLATAVVRFKNGVIGSIFGTTTSYPGRSRKLEITGTGGTIELEDDKIITWDFKDQQPEDELIRNKHNQSTSREAASDPSAITSNGHYKNIKAFIAAIEEGRKFEIDGREAAKSVNIIRKIYQSAGMV